MESSTTVVVSVVGLHTSNNFENNVQSCINRYLSNYDIKPLEYIYVSDAGIRRKGGYGQYEEYVVIRLDSEDFELKKHTTDAPTYDFFNNDDINEVTYSNALKRLVLSVIERNYELIEEKLSALLEEE